MRTRVPRACLLAAALLAAAPAGAHELTHLSLDLGHTEDNRIYGAVYETPAQPLVIEPLTSRVGAGAQVIRRLAGRVPRYDLGPGIDLGALLTTALQTEGTAMGLRLASSTSSTSSTSSNTGGWTVGGTLDDLYFEVRPVLFGPVLFYGYLQVTLTARPGAGEPRTLRYRLHNMYAHFNGGFGLQDEIAEATAQLLVESAQEIAARLNRDLIHAPANPSIPSRLAGLGPISGHEAELRAIGLSGARELAPALLARLAAEGDEAARANLIDALASLGAPEAVQPLGARYDGEDEDCRFFTLKAWDYIGGGEAEELVKTKGARDADRAAKNLAARIGQP